MRNASQTPEAHRSTAHSTPEIGRALPRREDARLLRGEGRFLDTIHLPGCLHAHFVRSPHARADILSIDVSALDSQSDVRCFTAEQVDAWVAPHTVASTSPDAPQLQTSSLATGSVRFHGDPLVCIVASDRYVAEDAADRVLVVYRPLPAVVDTSSALADGAPQVDSAVPGNLACDEQLTEGEVDAAWHRALRFVARRFGQHRQTHLPMETRGCIAQWDCGREHLTLTIGTQIPHVLRSMAAQRLKLREEQVTIVAPDIGGAFGQRLMLYREELCVAALAIRLKRPVRWREDRMENLLAAAHGREDEVAVECAVDDKGNILGMRVDIVSDYGAYGFFPASYMPRMVALAIPGGYRITAMACRLRAVLTNKCPVAPMRAPMAIASWVMESMVQAIADELGRDAIELRRQLLLRDDEQPFRTVGGQTLQDLNLHACLDRACAERPAPAFELQRAQALSRQRHRGRGLCVVVEPTTYGSAYYKAAGIPGSGHEAALLRIEPGGAVRVWVGVMGSGQGYETTFAQIVAQEMGVASSTVSILMGDTDACPYGMGSRGARGGTAGGNAVAKAARMAREKVLKIAAHRLGGIDSSALTLRDGYVGSADGSGDIDIDLRLADVARLAYLDPLHLPPGMDPGLEFSCTYEPPAMTYSNGVHVCDVEVDALTGSIEILDYLIVENSGVVVNPLVVDGQSHGAAAMGLSGVLMEEVVYGPTGQNLSATLGDYHVATPVELPAFRIVHLPTPSSGNPMGFKGMSEGAVLGSVGALCLAVQDALKPLGVAISRQPLTPERLWTLIEAANAGHCTGQSPAPVRLPAPLEDSVHAD